MIKWSEAEVIVDQVLASNRGRLHLAGIEIPREICNALRTAGLLTDNIDYEKRSVSASYPSEP